MHHTPCQAADGLPSLSLKPAFLGGNHIAGLVGDEQCMVWLASATGLAPCGPPRDCLPVVRASGFDAEAVAPGIQQVAQQHLSFVTFLRTNQFAESQLASAGHITVKDPLEGRIHLDNHSLRIASSRGKGSVFENGTERRSGVLSWYQLRPRKWSCGVHTDTVARDDSRKEPHDGLTDTSVLLKRESMRSGKSPRYFDPTIGGQI